MRGLPWGARPKEFRKPHQGDYFDTNDRGTNYDMFIKVRNELLGAYSELRNELAERKYGRSYDLLNEEAQTAISEVYPQFISEAEPVSVGG